MPARPIVGGMWGTSRLALYRLDGADGAALESRSGPGVSRMLGANFEDVLFDRCAGWLEQAPGAMIVLSGMVGSTVGWLDVPYLDCPVELTDVAARCKAFRSRGYRIHIVPGLACTNALGAIDVLRGEETELLAWLEHSQWADGRGAAPLPSRACVCIPGTHSKWVEIEGGRILRFLTGVTGEMFDVLSANGVLTSPAGAPVRRPGKSFMDGVTRIAAGPRFLLSHLFSVRSRVVRGQLAAEEAPEFMSGLLIGADVAGALAALEWTGESGVVPVIGAPELAERYVRALEHHGVAAVAADSEPLASRGLFLIARHLGGGRLA